MYVLGISCFFHDAAAALIRDGVVVAAAEEERFTRKKHDYEFPSHAIDYVLAAEGITADELDHVAFFEKPFLKFERILMTSLQTFPRGLKVFREATLTWLLDKLWVRALIEERLGVPREKILFSEHHLSHAASAFFCSPFHEAGILTVDGVGEWATATMGWARGTEIRLTREIRFPHSIGLLYSTFTAFLGFEVNEGEYKVMGMAPYGQPRYADKVEKLVRMFPDGSFALDMDYFAFHRSTRVPYSRKFVQLFGEPRPPGDRFFTESSGYPSYFGPPPADFAGEARRNQHYADLAASVQAVTERLVLNMARAVRRETGLPKLCLAGGVGLNSVANWKILRETGVDELYVHPAAGDSGGPIVRRGTLALVALGGSLRTDPGDPLCLTGGLQDGGAPLSRWSERCANLAVPLSWDIIDRVESAYCATRVQRALIQLGYDAGPIGTIDAPRFAAAIRQAQRDMGWAVTGEPSGALGKILWLRSPAT